MTSQLGTGKSITFFTLYRKEVFFGQLLRRLRTCLTPRRQATANGRGAPATERKARAARIAAAAEAAAAAAVGSVSLMAGTAATAVMADPVPDPATAKPPTGTQPGKQEERAAVAAATAAMYENAGKRGRGGSRGGGGGGFGGYAGRGGYRQY